MEKIVLVDTNIIREVISENQNIHQSFYDLLNKDVAIAFSSITFVELKKCKKIFKKFMSFCTKYNAILLLDSQQINTLEKIFFPNNFPKEKIVFYKFKNDFREIKKYLSSQKFKKLSNSLIKNQERKILDFKANKEIFIKNNINELDFDRIISESIEDKYEIKIDKNKVLHQNGMASEIIINLLELYKYGILKKDVNRSDPFDLLILSSVPYVDAVITENTNAAILRNLKEIYEPLKNVKIYTMKNLRKETLKI